MNKEEIEEAIKSGHKASSVLRRVLEDIAIKQTCDKSYGFEGRDTFPSCGECSVCIAKDIVGIDPYA